MSHHDDAHNRTQIANEQERERQLLAWQYQCAFDLFDEVAMDCILQRAERDRQLWHMICDIHREAIAHLTLHQFSDQEHDEAYHFVKDIMIHANHSRRQAPRL